jgi:hypothetical protein
MPAAVICAKDTHIVPQDADPADLTFMNVLRIAGLIALCCATMRAPRLKEGAGLTGR